MWVTPRCLMKRFRVANLKAEGVVVWQVEQATHTHLCTVMSTMHHRRTGYPFGTLVDFACDGAGQPIFCLSPLAIHTRNILADPRCSMVVQMPGWSGLANARVTIFGDVYQLPPEMQGTAREVSHVHLLCSWSFLHLCFTGAVPFIAAAPYSLLERSAIW